jgi:hypothetical protein
MTKGSPRDNLDVPESAHPGEWYSTWPSSQAGTPKYGQGSRRCSAITPAAKAPTAQAPFGLRAGPYDDVRRRPSPKG